MTELQRTGFFREMPHGTPQDRSLAEARRATPSPHEERIAAYLDAGHVYLATPGVTHDALAAGTAAPVAIGAPHLLTDGRFVWPADLAYYVRTYHVGLDGALVEHMLASGWSVPADVDLAALTLPRTSAAAEPGPPPDGAAPDTAATSAPPAPDLAAVFASFVQSLRAAGVDTDALGRSLGDAAREMRRATESIGQELRRAVEAAGAKLGAQFGAQLRRDAEAPRGTAGSDPGAELSPGATEAMAQAMTQVMTQIEAEVEALDAPQQRADDAERARRVASEVRATIAARLREHGLAPGGDGGEPDGGA